jgi:hypothetical protein
MHVNIIEAGTNTHTSTHAPKKVKLGLKLFVLSTFSVYVLNGFSRVEIYVTASLQTRHPFSKMMNASSSF